MTKETTLEVGVTGRFKLEAIRPDGSRRMLADWFDNLILDAGLERMGVGMSWNKCRVGTDNTAPANGQTALFGQVAEADQYSFTDGYDSVGNLYCWRRNVYRFSTGSAAGNLSEVGVGWTDGASGLLSRALIKDGGGSPTTITVLPDEILDVTYELRMYRPAADATVSVDISGVSYSCVIRAANMGTWRPNNLMNFGAGYNSNLLVQGWGSDAVIGAVTDQPSGTMNMGGVYAAPVGSYVTSSHERAQKVVIGLADCTSSIKGLIFYTMCGIYQLITTPVIPKDATNKLTFNFKISWARR